jgi:3-hydroxyacyl-[acyl-carrier-protein] dehydratase
MLLGDFFTIEKLQTEGNAIKTILVINPRHRIFDGHFPGLPVVPGVCMLQMIKETLEQVAQVQTRLVRADHLKFLSVIDPRQIQRVGAELHYSHGVNQEISLVASLFNEGTTFFKCKAVFTIKIP